MEVVPWRVAETPVRCRNPRWKDGAHFRRHRAGGDLTADLAGAPHGPEKLERFPAFPAADASPGEGAPIAKVFYAWPTLTLFVALGVLVVVRLRRSG